jgi:inosine/xanthosine triphosphatase
MDTVRIAVGSTRRPKLEAVREAASEFGGLLDANARFEIVGYQVESGVGHTPVSREELMRGARQRAEALVAKIASSLDPVQFYVGVEGGLEVAVDDGKRRVFLESWAYVTDRTRGHFGCSGSIELPALLAEEVLGRGTELSAAIDEFAGAEGIRDAQGAWGILSGNLISRKDSFRLAVLAAFAPFYNARMYRIAAAAGS